MYLETPLPYELDQNPGATESKRLYLDGDNLTLADCNLLPKVNIIKVSRSASGEVGAEDASEPISCLVPPQVVCKKYRNFDIPRELKGLSRYLDNAYKRDEFRLTCPNDSEILLAYQPVAKYLNK